MECGVNDISNAPAKNPKVALENKISIYKQVVTSLVTPEMEIIVLKPILRVDSDQKEKT